jgi:hypothetical protein
MKNVEKGKFLAEITGSFESFYKDKLFQKNLTNLLSYGWDIEKLKKAKWFYRKYENFSDYCFDYEC